MSEELRQLLYYPLGLLPSLFFTLRILVQWLESEKRHLSYNSSAFWKLSLSGNSLLCLHYIVQLQGPFALLQAGNAVIAWRNLNLLKKQRIFRTTQVLGILCITLIVVTGIYAAQSYYFNGEIDWIRTPPKSLHALREYHHFLWHLFGFIGMSLFASRFWVQWWNAERLQRSEFGKTFWWLSIIGSFISLIYFVHIGDNVSILHNGFGLIPYVRNLILIRKKTQIVVE